MLQNRGTTWLCLGVTASLHVPADDIKHPPTCSRAKYVPCGLAPRAVGIWVSLYIEALPTATRTLGIRIVEDELCSYGILDKIHDRAYQVHDCLGVYEYFDICVADSRVRGNQTIKGVPEHGQQVHAAASAKQNTWAASYAQRSLAAKWRMVLSHHALFPTHEMRPHECNRLATAKLKGGQGLLSPASTTSSNFGASST